MNAGENRAGGTASGARVAFDPAPGADRVAFGFPGRGADAPRALLSLRAAGPMTFRWGAPNPNREAFFASAGVDPRRALAVELVHSRRFAWADSPEDLPAGTACDGVLTRNRALAPSVTVADCMPIWLHDARSGAFGVLHSGWKGTGILAVAAEELRRRYGTAPADLSVILGPCIGPCCYRVDDGRAAAFRAEFGPASVRDSGDGPRLDLPAANAALAAGLGIGHWAIVDACTSCDPRLGSFRREGAERFTRMVATVGYFP